MTDHFAAFRKKKTIAVLAGNPGNQGNRRPKALPSKGLRLVPQLRDRGEPVGNQGNQMSLAELDLAERIAMAEIDGGVSPAF
jgi:hypothetical protein